MERCPLFLIFLAYVGLHSKFLITANFVSKVFYPEQENMLVEYLMIAIYFRLTPIMSETFPLCR